MAPSASVDCLFIHPSAHPAIPMYVLMPMGMFSSMSKLAADGNAVHGINCGLEMALDRSFRIEDILSRIDFKVAAIGLHWYEHAFTAIQVARACKEANPRAHVVLGGMTATLFAKEIIRTYPFVDRIIMGDAELSLLKFVETVRQGNESKEIDNVLSRGGSEDRTRRDLSDDKLSSSSTDLDSLDFLDLVHLRHWEQYLKCNISGFNRSWSWLNYWLPIGRGCNYECSYCGGCKPAQHEIYGRNGIVWRSMKKVVEDLIRLENELGVHVVNLSHDIELGGRGYWSQILAMLRSEGLKMGTYLEAWQLPTRAFIEDFARTFDQRFSTIAITVLSGNESVRRLNGKLFSNEDLEDRLGLLDDLDVSYALYFASGLPFESKVDASQGLKYGEHLATHFSPSMIAATPITLDPCSPMFNNPDKFGVKPHFFSFRDYYERCMRRANKEPYDNCGYHTNLLSPKEIAEQQEEWNQTLRKYALPLQANSVTGWTQFL